VGIAFAGSDHAGNRSAGDVAGRLDEHLQVKTVGKPPLNLTHRITRRVSMILDSGTAIVAIVLVLK